MILQNAIPLAAGTMTTIAVAIATEVVSASATTMIVIGKTIAIGTMIATDTMIEIDDGTR